MEWFKLHPKDFRQGALAMADSAPLGDWVRLTAACADLENSGRFADSKTYSTRQWMTIAGVTVEAIPGVVGAGLASWDGNDLLIHGYDVELQQKATERSKQNRELALRRWGNAKGNAKGNAEGTPEGNAEGEGEGELEGELEGDNTCPAGGPAERGGAGAGDVLPLVLVPTEAEAMKSRKAKPDSANAVYAVYKHYWSHGHPRREPLRTSKTWRAIAARLKDGWTIRELCKAVDGYHLSPHHQGQNDRGTVYLDLYLFVRDEEQVQKGIGYAENPPKPGSGAKPARDIRVGWFPAEACQHPDKTGRVDLP